MTAVDRPAYISADAAMDDLMQNSRRLELTRACHARVEAIYIELTNQINRLVDQRHEALKAIDALTESAPALDSVAVERAGRVMLAEVTALEAEAALVVERHGGLS